MSIFFVVSGMNFDLRILKEVGVAGLVYFLVRIVGKYLGASLGCRFTGFPAKIRDNLGLALIPQAGVAIGLAFMGQRLLPAEFGNLLLTIILASSILYELTGPVAAKAALFRSGAIAANAKKDWVRQEYGVIDWPRPIDWFRRRRSDTAEASAVTEEKSHRKSEKHSKGTAR